MKFSKKMKNFIAIALTIIVLEALWVFAGTSILSNKNTALYDNVTFYGKNGDVLVNGSTKFYLYDKGGEYMISDGSKMFLYGIIESNGNLIVNGTITSDNNLIELDDSVEVNGTLTVLQNLSVGAWAENKMGNTDNNLYVEDALEVDGISYFDGATYHYGETILSRTATNPALLISDGTYYPLIIEYFADDGIKLYPDSTDNIGNRNIIISDYSNRLKDHDHNTLSPNPTLFIHSIENPDNNNDRWGSIAHDNTTFLINSGYGGISLGNNTVVNGTLTVNGDTLQNGNINISNDIFFTNTGHRIDTTQTTISAIALEFYDNSQKTNAGGIYRFTEDTATATAPLIVLRNDGTGDDIYKELGNLRLDSQSGTVQIQDNAQVNGTLTVNGVYNINGTSGYTGTCVNVTYKGGLAISCND